MGRIKRMAVAASVAGLLAGGGAQAEARRLNGFVLEPARIPVEEILRGGPPRDGIPALDHPASVPAAEADWPAEAWVLGVALGGEARAYPIAILDWHELVNDTLGEQPILVSYCPLCGTGIVFDRRVAGETRSFGVSGLLYRSDLLMYDRETESLWSQISAEAVTGPLAGERLRLLRSSMSRWEDWRREHPETRVLTRDTGHRRDYGRSPYGDYARSERIVFPVPRDPRYHPKTPTLGVRTPGGQARAYPAVEVERAGGVIEERFAGKRVRVAFDPDKQAFRADVDEGLEVIQGFWFAWAAFHPETSVYAFQAATRAVSEPSPEGLAD